MIVFVRVMLVRNVLVRIVHFRMVLVRKVWSGMYSSKSYLS